MKTLLCAVTYLAAIVVSGAVIASLGVPLPTIPAAVDASLQFCGLLVGCVMLPLASGPLRKEHRAGA